MIVTLVEAAVACSTRLNEHGEYAGATAYRIAEMMLVFPTGIL